MLFLLLFPFASFGQGITDSVFSIREVRISAKQLFQKEYAGMKEIVLDSLIMEDKASQSLSDLLAANTTVYIKDYGRGALSTASIRGTAPAHTRVSWNGIRLNSPMLGMVDFSLIPVFLIDELSLKSGASSLSETGGGLGGMLEINKQVNWNNRFSAKYYQTVGSFSTWNEMLRFTIGSNRFQSKTTVYKLFSENDYLFENKNLSGSPLQRNKNASFGSHGFSQDFYLRTSGNTSLTLSAWYQNANRSLPSVLSSENAEKTSNRQNDESFRAVLEASGYGDKYSGKFRSGFDYQKLHYLVKSDVAGQGVIFPVNSGSNMLSWYNRYSSKYLLSDKLSINSNLSYNYYTISTLDSTSSMGYDINQHEIMLYTGLFYQPAEFLNLAAQLRKEWSNVYTTPLIYSLGFSIKPFPRKDLVIKSSLLRNFHSPSLNDKFWQPGGNPDLLPEEGHSWDIGLNWLSAGDRVKVSNEISFYLSEIKNWIIWLPGNRGYWEAFNINRVRSSGLENHFKLDVELNKTSIFLNANYTLAKTRNRLEEGSGQTDVFETQLPYIPVHSGNLFFTMENRGYFITYQYNTYSKRYLLNSSEAGRQDDSGLLGLRAENNPMYALYPYHMNNLSVGKEFPLHRFSFTAELKINNLFDETYRSVLQRIMPGRNYLLLLKVKF